MEPGVSAKYACSSFCCFLWLFGRLADLHEHRLTFLIGIAQARCWVAVAGSCRKYNHCRCLNGQQKTILIRWRLPLKAHRPLRGVLILGCCSDFSWNANAMMPPIEIVDTVLSNRTESRFCPLLRIFILATLSNFSLSMCTYNQ